MSEEQKPKGKIEFVQNHRPHLLSGDYKIWVSQSLEISTKSAKKTFVPAARKFSVLGPRFTLDPGVIRGVFPPAGSLGEHSNVLPHINFHRSSLPWERTPDLSNLKMPWLALLVFDQSELVGKKVAKDGTAIGESKLTLGKVSTPKNCVLKLDKKGSNNKENWRWTLAPTKLKDNKSGKSSEELLSPEFAYETGQHSGDPVSVIEIAGDLLKKLLPSKKEAQLLTHVRQPTDDLGKSIGEPIPTVLANRLPRSNRSSVVHLILLEGRYNTRHKSSRYDDQQGDLGEIWDIDDDNAFVRLVSLKSWRFTCLGEEHSFKGLLEGINRTPSTLRLPSPVETGASTPFLEQGYVAVPHEMRQGNRSVSWYHGPFAPGRVSGNGVKETTRSADQLMRYNPDNAMFDVSYAAAWELGRLLTVQNNKVAVSLHEWKRRHRHLQQRQQAKRELEHLPIVGQPAAASLPQDIVQWFEDLAVLRGVPFNYLIPDERMLPAESIRFFQVDPQWVRCLHDGVMSIGFTQTSDKKPGDVADWDILENPHAMMSGFMLRSEVVSGWPDLLIEAYAEVNTSKDYENKLRIPQPPIKHQILLKSDAISKFEKQLNKADGRQLKKRFGFSDGANVAINSIAAESSWLINVDENKEIYRLERIEDGFQLLVEEHLPLLRMERLSPNVLLCLFAGEVKTVDIHQKPEVLHFGFNRPGEGHSGYYKSLRKPTGDKLAEGDLDMIYWKSGKNMRVVSISDLYDAIIGKISGLPVDGNVPVSKDVNAALLALQLTEGVQKVRFAIGS